MIIAVEKNSIFLLLVYKFLLNKLKLGVDVIFLCHFHSEAHAKACELVMNQQVRKC